MWWEKYGLIREPDLDVFPLSIDNAYLFVETHSSVTFNTLLSKVDDPFLLLHKVYALVGTFGSGKTTTVAYIRYKFHFQKANICSINLNWKQKPLQSSDGVRDWFFTEMGKQLLRIYRESTEQDIPKSIEAICAKSSTDEDDVLELIRALSDISDGLIVFIDELHREEEAKRVEYIFDFLKSMQPFFTEARRSPVAFFIACHEDWRNNFELNKYSGIFSEVIILPSWNAEQAHNLIQKRLRDASVDLSAFKPPIQKGSLEKLISFGLIKYRCPREWLIHAKRLFRDSPESVHEITPAIVSSIFSQIDGMRVDQIRSFAESDSNGNRILTLLLDLDPEQAIKLLTVIGFTYHNDLLRPISESVCKLIGYDDLPLLVEKLKENKILNESRRTSPPRKVGRGAVETLYQEVFKLTDGLTQFFEKVEEKFGFEPEDYLLKLLGNDVDSEESPIRPVENDADIERMKTLAQKLVTTRAKNHLQNAIEDYSAFIGSAFSSVDLNRTVARAGILTLHDIVGAFIIEKTRDSDHKVDLKKDLDILKTVLKVGEKQPSVVIRLSQSFKNIDDSGLPISEDFSETAKRQIPKAVSKLLAAFDEWASKSPEERSCFRDSRKCHSAKE